jgi:hypothetical protein
MRFHVKPLLMTSKIAITLGALVAIVPGCIKMEEVNAENVATVRGRAAFDLRCGADALTFSPVVVGATGYPREFVTQWGVEGCGQRAVYVRTPMGEWVSNGVSSGEPAPTTASRQ